jgi:hypothetical protein
MDARQYNEGLLDNVLEQTVFGRAREGSQELPRRMGVRSNRMSQSFRRTNRPDWHRSSMMSISLGASGRRSGGSGGASCQGDGVASRACRGSACGSARHRVHVVTSVVLRDDLAGKGRPSSSTGLHDCCCAVMVVATGIEGPFHPRHRYPGTHRWSPDGPGRRQWWRRQVPLGGEAVISGLAGHGMGRGVMSVPPMTDE